MVASLKSFNLNPTLGYKLDPGEPGLAYSAPASRSIIRVLSQEVSNLIAFKNEALRKGGVVIYSKISLDMQKRGIFLAAVAGKTEVRILIPGEKEVMESGRPESEDPQIRLEKLKNEIERELLIENDQDKVEELKQKLLILNSIFSNPVLKNSDFVVKGLMINDVV
ncbi:MAG: hypothetical protein PWQ20_720 [Thermotogaceae bacterium]|jgi:hypothetical protein|nr:hypothetical protein [Thermotogaceae bacterium]